MPSCSTEPDQRRAAPARMAIARNPDAPPRAADRLELFYSPLATLAATGVFMAFAGIALYWIVLAFSGHPLLIIVGLVAGLVGGPMLLSFAGAVLHPWRHRGPVVIFDADGVRDVRKDPPFVPWSAVGRVDLGVGERASFLCFEFRQPRRDLEDGPRLGPLGTLLKRGASLGDWNITLRLLACRKGDVLTAARRFHQRSVRRVIEDKNKGRAWSGTL